MRVEMVFIPLYVYNDANVGSRGKETKEQRSQMYEYTHTHTYTYIYTYMSFCVAVISPSFNLFHFMRVRFSAFISTTKQFNILTDKREKNT